MNSLSRVKILQLTVVGVVLVLLVRLFYLQVVDDSYKTRADNNALRYMVQFPPRGEVYDRNGRFLVQSKEAYDLMATPREVGPFDTAAMSRILGGIGQGFPFFSPPRFGAVQAIAQRG